MKFFRTSKNGLKSDYFTKIAHKIAKPKYFPNIFDDSDYSDKFPFRRYIICWGNLSLSKIIGGGGGGHPRTAASFYSAKLCIVTQKIQQKYHILENVPVPPCYQIAPPYRKSVLIPRCSILLQHFISITYGTVRRKLCIQSRIFVYKSYRPKPIHRNF